MRNRLPLSMVCIALIVLMNFSLIPAEAARPGTITITVKDEIDGKGGLRDATVTVYLSESESGPFDVCTFDSKQTGGGGKVRFTGTEAYPNYYIYFTVSFQDYGTDTWPPGAPLSGSGWQLDSKGSFTVNVPYPSPI